MFGRLQLTCLVLLLQLAWFALLVLRLNEYYEYFAVTFTIASILMALFVIYRDDNPAYKLGWIMLISLVPIFGALMYGFFGNKRPSRRIRVKVNPVQERHRRDLVQKYQMEEINDSRLMRTINYIAERGPFPAWDGTKSRYYDLADKAFPELLADLKNAEHYIFMEYFIIGSGVMWDQVHAVLKEKAAAGLDVRLIYDDVGSIDKLPLGFAGALEAEGIKTCIFNPLRPIVSLVYNNRDHRKITVIDGYIAYSGGYNIADEYINVEKRFGHWKDTGIRLEGKAVWNFTVMFLNMWNAFRKTEDDYTPFRPQVHHPGLFDSDGIVQPFSDTPLDDENLSENVYMEIITQAEEYVYIFTPYLILDNEMQSCLTLAAKRGVDVRIVTPGIPDKKLIYRLTRSYYMPLIKAGVRIYEYTPGFIHAKSILADDRVGVVGSINLDYRSLYLHFECGTAMIGSHALYDLKRDCRETFLTSRRVQKEDCHTGFIGVLLDSVLRVLSPLL
ncbi:MAG: cardiolipin synthase [Clostridia bacterium]|nr:cardiolipin synthase [Clostridia bacterium]